MIKRSVFLILFCFSWLPTMSMAQPAQRVIVMFKMPLDEKQNTQVFSDISHLLPHNVNVEKAESSSMARWVLIIKPALKQNDLHEFMNSVKQLNNINWVEEDQLLQHQTPNNSLN